MTVKSKTDNQKISEKIIEKDFTEVKNVFGQFTGAQKAYEAKEVDSFLSEVIQDVEKLEKNTEKLYNFYIKHKDTPKEATPEQPNAEVTKQFAEVTQLAQQNVRSMPDGLSKIQNHMTELLIQAEQKSLQIVQEAEKEGNQKIEDAKRQAQEILEAAQEKTNEMSRRAQEKIEEFRIIKQDMEARAIEIEKGIRSKANEVEQMGREFVEKGRSLKQLVTDEPEQKMA